MTTSPIRTWRGVPGDDDSSRLQPQPTIVAVFRSGGGPGVEQSLPARIVAADGEENRDLAILQVQGVNDPPEPIAMSDAAEPTLLMPVLIFGFPFGNIDMSLNPAVHRNPSITVNRGSALQHAKRSIQPARTHPDRWIDQSGQ